MAQIFGRTANLVIKLSLLAAVVMLATGILLYRWAVSSQSYLQEPIQQPVPFSHKHHVSDDGIDCRYCHTGVEETATAGIPPLATCMTCHSQLYTDQPVLERLVKDFRANRPIKWLRVTDLPDFVYFNHSIHINKGIGCASCHGRVDTMPVVRQVKPLTMEFCLQCHRDPAKHLRPPGHVFDMSWKPKEHTAEVSPEDLMKLYHVDTRSITDCSTCHR